MKRSIDIPRYVFRLSVALLIFAYGVSVGRFQLFPFEILRFAYESFSQIQEELPTLTGARPSGYLRPSRYDGAGVTVLELDRAAPGLTLLYGSFDSDPALRLIRLDGTVLREWKALVLDIFEAQHSNLLLEQQMEA